MKQLIKQILKEESIKQDLKNEVKEYGWRDVTNLVGDTSTLADLAFNNDPMEFLNMYNDLDVVQSKEYPDWTLFRYKPRHNLMLYDRENENVYIDWEKIWSFLEQGFGLNYDETQKLTESWLNEAYNLSGVTTPNLHQHPKNRWLRHTI